VKYNIKYQIFKKKVVILFKQNPQKFAAPKNVMPGAISLSKYATNFNQKTD